MPYSNQTKPVVHYRPAAPNIDEAGGDRVDLVRKMTGTVRIFHSAAAVELAVARMTSGVSATDSAANLRSRSAPPPQRMSSHTFWPSICLIFASLAGKPHASLSFLIVCSRTHKHANTANAFSAVRPQRAAHSHTADERDGARVSHCVPEAKDRHRIGKNEVPGGAINVRFRCWRTLSQVSIMSALPPEAGIAISCDLISSSPEKADSRSHEILPTRRSDGNIVIRLIAVASIPAARLASRPDRGTILRRIKRRI
jgi:hypothetical protein